MNAIKTGKYILKRTWGIFLLAAIIIASGTWEKRITDFENPKVYAWWGTIYPEFCFEKVEDNGENKPVKISFWLAKALDW